jgi:serine phosphatase RsbU (regulator of sigma subunit)/anti-sigma regulatory factor (Ser/Thr protein kinase)
MTTFFQTVRRLVRGRDDRESTAVRVPQPERRRAAPTPTIEIAPNDPLVAYFLSVPGAVEIERLRLESPALEALRAAGIRMVVPLISQGELIGVISLGPRLSQQDYSSDDRGLLSNLAVQAAPAVRVAQLVRQQQIEARQRERIEHELRVAQLVQQTLLPKAIPSLAGWQIDRHYQPAREVGGDFYDFINLPDGQLGLVIGDVTDKGVPAALVMATTRSMLRTGTGRTESPGAVLGRVNDLLYDEIPPNMFVTCLYAILEPNSGRLRFANAGHDLPYRYHAGGVDELHARGMPLGLMPGMAYEEKEITLAPGEGVVFYSDGIVEAHNVEREMFSFGRLQRLLAEHQCSGAALVSRLLDELARFTGEGWEQEDDITMVLLERSAAVDVEPALDLQRSATDVPAADRSAASSASTRLAASVSSVRTPVTGVYKESGGRMGGESDEEWRTLTQLTLSSEPGNERVAMEQVGEAVRDLGLLPRRLERLKTAVAEATMNAIEHGNQNRPELPVEISVRASGADLMVAIVDQGGAMPISATEAPDLYAKLDGEQSPRGWGLFLIKSMVDDMRVSSDERHHRIELIMHLEGASNASQTA